MSDAEETVTHAVFDQESGQIIIREKTAEDG